MILVRGKSYFEQNRSLIQLIEAPQQMCVSWSHLESRYFSHESRTRKLVENQGKQDASLGDKGTSIGGERNS